MKRAFACWSVLLLLAALFAPGPVRAATTTIVAFGDSLTAGYGVTPEDAFPVRLEAALKARGRDVRVINAGVSGDTSAGGLARLDWSLADKPNLIVLELGSNDMLRGIDPGSTEANLDAILRKLTDAKIPVLLCGMFAARNLGPDYVGRFDAIYPKLAQKYGVPLHPFFLDGVALDAKLNQGDGMHPNPAGVKIIVDRIAPVVEKLLPAQ
ncbi:arylesterase [Roseiterribacter gracilis]|uniref:Arylesterase n=1 Tax=Roseiterribacter gracilis TaxID=2812848 RepID=A0A8S8XGJ2_9PROT|nr:arylesterase [Rhodospirillales bacterium TMPK1]